MTLIDPGMADTGNSKSSFEPPPKQSSPEKYIFVASSMGYTIKQYVSAPTTDDLPYSSSITQKDRASFRPSTSPEEVVYLKARIYVNNKAASAGLSTGAKIAIGVGAAVLGGAAAALAAPLVLAGVGFTAGGVSAGSMAASWQSSIGNVVAKSLDFTIISNV
ncbi:hypothetical protein Anas_09614 [Armadillidium nasatum]|uniref:Uncharacterized protein n=1 Tax=Armadillidium nasatum TaxID=96803 RepID=A0A5N5SUQ0_9CRUS|nr:hypothetical protein Anas_09614 [Armadillidium nasatum]